MGNLVVLTVAVVEILRFLGCSPLVFYVFCDVSGLILKSSILSQRHTEFAQRSSKPFSHLGADCLYNKKVVLKSSPSARRQARCHVLVSFCLVGGRQHNPLRRGWWKLHG